MAAREDYAKRGFSVEYVNVKIDPLSMDRMLEVSGGRRDVPIIVEGGEVVIGFGGT